MNHLKHFAEVFLVIAVMVLVCQNRCFSAVCAAGAMALINHTRTQKPIL